MSNNDVLWCKKATIGSIIELHVTPSTPTKKDAVTELADFISTNHSTKVLNVAGRSYHG